MSEKLLLLFSAKSGVLVKKPVVFSRWFFLAALCGAFVVVVGAADVAARLAGGLFGAQANFFVFAPAPVAIDPSLQNIFSNGARLPATTTPLIPARISIPALGVDATVEKVGKNTAGAMGAPQKFSDVSWYALGPKPGQEGNAVFAGHVNNALSTNGVFEHLSQISIGDKILVSDLSGRRLVYAVVSADVYTAGMAPMKDIFATAGPSQVVLITCNGDWVESNRSYDRRLVVVARLASL